MGPLLDKHTFFYCCFSSAGCWQTHADIKAAGLEIGGQAVEGERLWSEKINEGNRIAPYLRQPPAPNHSYTHTNTDTHTHTHCVWQAEALSSMSGPMEHHPWGGSSNQTSSLLQKHSCKTFLPFKLIKNSNTGCQGMVGDALDMMGCRLIFQKKWKHSLLTCIHPPFSW